MIPIKIKEKIENCGDCELMLYFSGIAHFSIHPEDRGWAGKIFLIAMKTYESQKDENGIKMKP